MISIKFLFNFQSLYTLIVIEFRRGGSCFAFNRVFQFNPNHVCHKVTSNRVPKLNNQCCDCNVEFCGDCVNLTGKLLSIS